MRNLRCRLASWLCRPSNALSVLAACLLALDHRFTALTWGGLSLLAGSMLARRADA